MAYADIYFVLQSRMETHTLPPIEAAHQGQRLDKYLASSLPTLSRTRLQSLLQQGYVELNDIPFTSKTYKVKEGDCLTVHEPPAEPTTIEAEDIPLDVVYEDADLLVINKPAGLTMHPAPGNYSGTLVNALLHYCTDLSGIGGVERPGLVHRLDKDTSGLVVVAKNDAAHQHLSAQFADRTIERQYTALVYGHPQPNIAEIEGNIGRHPKDRKKMAVVENSGKPARTKYNVQATFSGPLALVTCKLFTGRTHQIRVHIAHHGHPLVGDPVYGRPRVLKHLPEEVLTTIKNTHRQMLHATTLGFTHPVSGQNMRFEQQPPADMATLIQQLKEI